jgi:DNA polymerase-3 subunit gamma/tau
MSWFLKYRPKQIADLDLTQVRTSFQRLMDSGQFPQAFLFAGPKGTGKTSASRIIGALLNDPMNERAVQQLFFAGANKSGQVKKTKSSKTIPLVEPGTDSDFAQRIFTGQSYVVQELDAASHRRIDDIRQLKEIIHISPQEGLISVYILDEVHMLTNEAFNALLKLLEEPPPHVVFILATTELHKVPATIVSRCNLVVFTKASLEEITQRLTKILILEKVEFEADALLEIARRADGSFRDAVKLAEIVSQAGQVSLEAVEQTIGGSLLIQVKQLVNLVLQKNESTIAQFFQELREQNTDELYFIQSLFDYLHHDLLCSLGVIDQEPELPQKVSQFLLGKLLELDFSVSSPISFLSLELMLLELVQQATKSSGSGNKSSDSSVKAKQSPRATLSSSSAKSKETLPTDEIVKIELVKPIGGVEHKILNSDQTAEMISDNLDGSLSTILCQHWEEFLKMVELRNSTLAALLRSSQPQATTNGVAQILVYYRFHQEQLQQPKFQSIIEECGQSIVGDKIHFNFILLETPVTAEVLDIPAQVDSLEALVEKTLV